VGAGPVGTLMGLLLARRGHRVRLFERRRDPRLASPERGRSINLALSARGIAALQRADILARVESSMIAMPGRMLHDEQQRQQFVPYGRNEREINHAVSRERLNRLIVEAAAEHPLIELHFDQRCVDFDPDAGTLWLRDENHRQACAARRSRFYWLPMAPVQPCDRLCSSEASRASMKFRWIMTTRNCSLRPAARVCVRTESAAYLATRRLHADRATQHRSQFHGHIVSAASRPNGFDSLAIPPRSAASSSGSSPMPRHTCLIWHSNSHRTRKASLVRSTAIVGMSELARC
jgi:hypothetical protein